MAYLRVLRHFQVLQDGTRSHHTAFQVFHAEALHVFHTEMPQQLLHGRLLGKHPVVHLKRQQLRAEILLKILLPRAVYQHLLRLQITHQLLHVVVCTLACQELTCRNIQESHATGCFAKVYGTEEVVFLVVQHRIAHSYARRH